MTRIIGVAVRIALMAVLACGALLAPSTASAALPPIKHVFVLVDENESASTTFGPSSPAPYLSKTLVGQGAFLPNYYGIGHLSLDNYIAMVSGQAPNPTTSLDCGTYAEFATPGMSASGQETGAGCVYPAGVPTLMSQFTAAGLTWRGYMDGMGADPTREAATCGHPPLGSADNTQAATPTDQYATRHDPFMYFHSVIDNAAQCSAHVVNLNQLPTDLASAATTPNYSFITPNLCDDGHDTMTANCPVGGLPQVDTFLQTWVPKITSSPAFKQNGLLIIVFDEAVGDTTSCCGEMPGPTEAMPGLSGPGGGVVGAVLLSPYIAPGTRTTTAYNHYSMLGSVEDLFGLPRLAYATGTTGFGSDVFTRPPVAPQLSGVKLKPAKLKKKHLGSTISYSDSQAAVTKLTIEQLLPGYRLAGKSCKALKSKHKRPKHSKKCTVTKTVTSFTHTDTAGSNSIVFTGRVHGHALPAGSYVLIATPTLNGLSGKPATAKFQIR
jgi:phosphatidylinositol-3-phosphatase